MHCCEAGYYFVYPRESIVALFISIHIKIYDYVTYIHSLELCEEKFCCLVVEESGLCEGFLKTRQIGQTHEIEEKQMPIPTTKFSASAAAPSSQN